MYIKMVRNNRGRKGLRGSVKDSKKNLETGFLLLCSMGVGCLLFEAGLQWFGGSVCRSEGCRLAVRLTRFGDIFMISVGLGVLITLTVLSALNRKRPRPVLRDLIHLLLVGALAVEGFLVGYQLFWLPEICWFCLSVFGLFLILGFLRMLAGQKEAVFGLAAMAALVMGSGLVLPPPGNPIPFKQKMILFISEDCKHCAEIKAELEARKLDVLWVQVDRYANTLNSLGIDSVPTLLINGRFEKIFLTGQDSIRRYLQQSTSSAGPFSEKTPPPKGSVPKTEKHGPTPSPGDLFSPDRVFDPARTDEACKQYQKCD